LAALLLLGAGGAGRTTRNDGESGRTLSAPDRGGPATLRGESRDAGPPRPAHANARSAGRDHAASTPGARAPRRRHASLGVELLDCERAWGASSRCRGQPRTNDGSPSGEGRSSGLAAAPAGAAVGADVCRASRMRRNGSSARTASSTPITPTVPGGPSAPKAPNAQSAIRACARPARPARSARSARAARCALCARRCTSRR
jgi:hypothetical protein